MFINDGSTEELTNSILSEFEEKGCITLINTDHKGVSNARNEGIKHARGEFVIFFDPDDKYSSDESLTNLLQAAKRSKQAIGFF